jgi:hypothetical protein
MEAASGWAIPTKLCGVDAVTPAKWHRAQQFTGGKNTAPRRQRHTAHRIWAPLSEEYPVHPIAEPTVRRYVQRRK